MAGRRWLGMRMVFLPLRFVLYPQLRAAYHWRLARKALDRDNLPAAQVHLKYCAQGWPASGEVQFLMARTCRRGGDFAEARTYLQEADRLRWDKGLVDLEYYLMEAQAGMVGPVEKKLERYLATRPGEEEIILEGLAIGYLQVNLLEEAYNSNSYWLERHPENWQPWFWQGRILESGARYDQAAEAYKHALERKPEHLESHFHLAHVLLWRGRYPEALPHFQAYLQSNPQHPAALLGLARCQRVVASPETALATLEQLLSQGKDEAGGFLLRGQLEMDLDHPEEALSWLRRAERLAPQDMDTNQALATVLRRLKKEPEARIYERKRLQIQQDIKRIEAILQEIPQSPRDVALRYEAGTILMKLRQDQEASRWLLSVLLLDPNHQLARKALTDCFRRSGDPKLVASYRRILESGRDHSVK